MLSAAVFPVTFEQAEAALAALPRLFIEPDGSFVWVADDAQRLWQVDGNLYDRNGRLLYVEVKGSCPAAAFDRLLRAVGWPDVPLAFQLVREAVYLDEAGFRRYAGIGMRTRSTITVTRSAARTEAVPTRERFGLGQSLPSHSHTLPITCPSPMVC